MRYVPSRKYFTKTAFPSLYAETHDKLRSKDLREVEYYSLTTDLWLSTGKIEPYLAVTTTYVDKEWELNPIVYILFSCHRTTLE